MITGAAGAAVPKLFGRMITPQKLRDRHGLHSTGGRIQGSIHKNHLSESGGQDAEPAPAKASCGSSIMVRIYSYPQHGGGQIKKLHRQWGTANKATRLLAPFLDRKGFFVRSTWAGLLAQASYCRVFPNTRLSDTGRQLHLYSNGIARDSHPSSLFSLPRRRRHPYTGDMKFPTGSISLQTANVNRDTGSPPHFSFYGKDAPVPHPPSPQTANQRSVCGLKRRDGGVSAL